MVGQSARRLPSPADLRRAVGIVAHVFSTPIPAVWEMELADAFRWAVEGAKMMRRPSQSS